jgi:hypothetical protein
MYVQITHKLENIRSSVVQLTVYFLQRPFTACKGTYKVFMSA